MATPPEKQKSFILLFSRLSGFQYSSENGGVPFVQVGFGKLVQVRRITQNLFGFSEESFLFFVLRKKMIEEKNKSLIGSNDIGHSRLPLGLIWQVVGGNNRVLFEESAFVDPKNCYSTVWCFLIGFLVPLWWFTLSLCDYPVIFFKCTVISDYVVLLYGFTTWITRSVTIYQLFK